MTQPPTPGRPATVVAVYDDLEQAERAVDELRRFGFSDDQIGLAVSGEMPPAAGPDQAGSNQPHEHGAQPSAVGGAVVGGVLGALAAGMLPGIGPVFVGGLLGGLLEGAAAGGLLGLLVGLGVPEPRARASVQAFELGRAIVVVHAEGDLLEEARDRLEAYAPAELGFGSSEFGVRGVSPNTSSLPTPNS